MTNMEVKQERERMERIGYVDVHDLCRDCLIELKCNYMAELVNDGTFGEVFYNDSSIREPSMGDYAEADNVIPDDFIFEHYAGIGFVPDDFFCLMETEE